MPSLLKKVKTRLAISAHRRTTSLLEGSYASIHQGRSHDFDDLREYVIGDDVKDIDWKATARLGTLLVKRFVAVRQHTIVFVVDTGRSMAAAAPDGESKSEVAITVTGMLASLATKHGDTVSLFAGDAAGLVRMPPRSSDGHLETMLRRINNRIRLDGPPSNLARVLDAVRRSFVRRLMLVIVTDDSYIDEVEESLLKRLVAQHEVIWVSIADLPLAGSEVDRDAYDVDSSAILPALLRSSPAIAQELERATAQESEHNSDVLKRLGISHTVFTSSESAAVTLLELLEEHRRVGR